MNDNDEKNVQPLFGEPVALGGPVQYEDGPEPEMVPHAFPEQETDGTELGQTPDEKKEDTTIVSRQLSPLVREATETIRKGIEKSNKDTLLGFFGGVVAVLGLHYIFSEKD